MAEGGKIDPTLGEVIRAAINFREVQQRRQTPCVVVHWDPSNQTATIKTEILYEGTNAAGEVVFFEPAVISGVPVCFYGTQNWGLGGPIRAGDRGLAFIADRCIAEWKSSIVTPTQPKIRRRWDISDAFFVPLNCRPCSPLPTNDNSARGFVDAANNEQVVLWCSLDGGISLGSLAVNSLIALADLVENELNDIKTQYDAHTHGYSWTGTPGSGSTGTPTALNPIGSVASDRVSSE